MLQLFDRNALLGFLYKDARLTLNYRMSLGLNLLSILFAVTTYFFMGGSFTSNTAVYQKHLFEFLLVGIMCSTLLTAIMNGLASSITMDMQCGVLELLLIRDRNPLMTFLYMSAWNGLQALAIAAIYFMIGRWFFGAEISLSRILPLAVFLFLSLLTFFALGLLAASFILRFKRGNPIQWALSSLQILLGGVYFPLEALPPGIKLLAYALPLSHSIRAARALLIPADASESLWGSFFLLALQALLLLPMAVFTLQRTLQQIRRHGSFSQS